MVFLHSAIVSVDRWKSVEAWPSMPLDIQPVFLGSGLVAFGLDATGMQGLDARVIEQPGVVSLTHLMTHTSDDLYICHAATLSKHYRHEYIRAGAPLDLSVRWANEWTLMPAGWFDYVLTIDGIVFGAEDIARQAKDWRRSFCVADGSCLTEFLLADVLVCVTGGIGLHENLSNFEFTFESLDHKDHAIEIAVRINLQTHAGEDLATGGLSFLEQKNCVFAQWSASPDTSIAPLKESYTFCYGIAAPDTIKTVADCHGVSLRCSCVSHHQKPTRAVFHLFFGCSQSGCGTIEQATPFLHAALHDADAAIRDSAHSWQTYFGKAATFSIGDVSMEYVFHVNQYYLAAGADWTHGIPCDYLWSSNFAGSTYWDSYFMVDGMLRCGHPDLVGRFIQWLAETVLPKNCTDAADSAQRPFYWIHYYDGEAWADDVAYQVLAAHAASAIRYYEFTRDQAILKKWVYPIVRAVALYIRRKLLGLYAGEWRITVIMSGDVNGDDATGEKETGVLSWMVAALAKAVEYGRLTGESENIIAEWSEVVDAIKQKPFDWSQRVMWWSWLPYMAGGAEPFYSMRQWKEGIVSAFKNQTLHYNIESQPWGAFCAAASCLMAGLSNAGLRYIEHGMRFVYGHGGFCEFRYDRNENAGIAPFPTASGAFLSAIAVLFVNSTVWDDELGILCSLPVEYQSRKFTFDNFSTVAGACVSGRYSPDTLQLEIKNDRSRRVRIGVPVSLRAIPLLVTCNEGAVSPELSDDCTELIFPLDAGEFKIVVAEDIQTRFDVVMFEPKYRSKYFLRILQEAGIWPRLIRDGRTVGRYASCAPRVIIVPSSLVQIPAHVVDALESYVSAGGCLIGLHHAGVFEVNPRLSVLLGVNATTDNRFTNTFSKATFRTIIRHPLTVNLPESFTIDIADRIISRSGNDVQVALVNAESGAAVATVRRVGPRGGLAVWLEPGQEWSGNQVSPFAQPVELDLLNIPADERYAYPYLDCPHFGTLLANAVAMGMGER